MQPDFQSFADELVKIARVPSAVKALRPLKRLGSKAYKKALREASDTSRMTAMGAREGRSLLSPRSEYLAERASGLRTGRKLREAIRGGKGAAGKSALRRKGRIGRMKERKALEKSTRSFGRGAPRPLPR